MKGLTALFASLLLLAMASADGMAQKGRTSPGFSRAVVDGVELEYQVLGAGEPVVLVHAGVFADWFKPLLEEPALTGRCRVVSYHRVGYAGSGRVAVRSASRIRPLTCEG
jgi:hypothetical protein